MEEKKITIGLTTVIVIAVIFGALVSGIVSYIFYNQNKTTEAEMEINKIEQSTINSSSNVEKDESDKEKVVENKKTNSNLISSAKEEAATSTSSNSTEGKASTKQNPLSVGEWGLAAKYSSGEYIDVPVKVINVTRGNAAAQKVKEYCEGQYSIYKYEEPEDGMEWAIVEYDVDLSKIEGYKSIKVDTAITGTGENASIKYKGVTYVVSTMNMTTDSIKEDNGTAYFAVQLPVGCTDYLMVLGSSEGSQAYFRGE